MGKNGGSSPELEPAVRRLFQESRGDIILVCNKETEVKMIG